MDSFYLKVIAYDRVFFEGEAESIQVPAVDGGLEILSHHEEYVIALKEGEFVIRTASGERIPAVCGQGMAEVTDENKVFVIVDTIEKPEEIDVRRAREAKERAEEQLRQKQSQIEFHRSKASLARAMARLKEASKYS